MKRIVLDCLPFEDPGNEARRIVRSGMSSIIDSFSEEVWDDWYAGSPPVAWGGPMEPRPQMVDVLVDEGRGITFCSRGFDEEAKRWEWLVRRIRAEFHYSRELFAIPHRVWAGVSET